MVAAASGPVASLWITRAKRWKTGRTCGQSRG